MTQTWPRHYLPSFLPSFLPTSPESGGADGHDGGDELVDLREAGLGDAHPVHGDPVQGGVVLQGSLSLSTFAYFALTGGHPPLYILTKTPFHSSKVSRDIRRFCQ